ncbi:uncharacterized protein Dwil_GK24227 [Drosophila willistoni]|uniref:BED-type domain-containing protein n=1 Tax=Drosophila willistoni TaxID=7260 RepID=B4N161_DROWI|nr:uncharacterized protein Dwil_GK24227 [Drosophila willistoni]
MARSKVWKYYDKLDHNTAQCQLCERIIKTCGNTSNLMKHIKTHPQINVNNDDAQVVRGMFKRHGDDMRRRFRKLPHQKDHHQIKSKGELHAVSSLIGKSDDEEAVSVYDLETVETVESVTYGWEDPSQSPTTENIIEFEPKHVNNAGLYPLNEQDEQLPQTDDDQIFFADEDHTMETVYQSPSSPQPTTSSSGTQTLLSQLAYFVCRDRHPVEVILGEGFKHLMQSSSQWGFQPWPTVDQLSAHIETQRQAQVARLRRKLAANSILSLSCAIHENNCLEVVAHYHENRIPQSRILSVQMLTEHYNVKQIVDHLESTCQRFDIEKSVIACLVTEGDDSLLEKAVGTFLGEQRHVPCLGHLLNTLLMDILKRPEFYNLVEKIRLKMKKKRDPISQCPLFAYKTLEKCVQMEGNVLSATEIKQAQQLISIIKPLTSSLRELSRNCPERKNIASQTLPMIYTMIEELKRRPISTIELNMIYECRMFIVRRLEVCFESLEKNEYLALSTLLDPRFRNTPFQSGSLVANYMTHLYELRQEELDQNDHIINDPEDDSVEDYNIWSAYNSHCREKYNRNNSTHPDEKDDEIANLPSDIFIYQQLQNNSTGVIHLTVDAIIIF